jgi:DtxR family Mn-dependent transcriptional regulator
MICRPGHEDEHDHNQCVLKITAAVEDYLKTIYALSAQGEVATTSTISGRLGIAPPSVSSMVKRLAEEDLVERPGPGRVTLTPHGEWHARRVVRRHRLLETFLAQSLGVPWDEVHAEAEVLEHALSDRLEDRIDALLGHPTHDPHGDPIPPKHGSHDERWGDPLEAALPGTRFLVERVSDRDSEVLRYLADLGIRPGVTVTVEERAPFGGPLWVRVARRRHALGLGLARLIHGTVEPA